MEVVLVDESQTLVTDVDLRLQAQLLFDNGLLVPKPTEQEQLLVSASELLITGGRGVLQLKMATSIVSSKMGQQNFHVTYAPCHSCDLSSFDRRLGGSLQR